MWWSLCDVIEHSANSFWTDHAVRLSGPLWILDVMHVPTFNSSLHLILLFAKEFQLAEENIRVIKAYLYLSCFLSDCSFDNLVLP